MKKSQNHFLTFILLFLSGLGGGKVGECVAARKTKQTVYADRLDTCSLGAAAAPHTSQSKRGVILEGKQ